MMKEMTQQEMEKIVQDVATVFEETYGHKPVIQEFPLHNTKVFGIETPTKEGVYCTMTYLFEVLENVEDTAAYEKAIRDFVNVLQQNPPCESVDMGKILNADNLLSNVFCTVINSERNKELLASDVIQEAIHGTDIAMVYKAILFQKDYVISTYITGKMAKKYGFTPEDIIAAGKANIRSHLEIAKLNFWGLSDVTEAVMEGQIERSDCPALANLYAISIKEHKYGGATGFMPEILERMAAFLQSDQLIVFPSSVHELLVTPYDSDDAGDITEYTDLVKAVNGDGNLVSTKDFLSDYAMLYTLEDNSFKMIA